MGKREDIKTILYNNNIDVLAISETWLNEKIETSYMTIDGYTFLRRDRGSRGGGVGLYISNSLKFKKITSSGEIEQLWDVDEKIDFLSNAILSVLDKHAPYKLVRFTKKPAPWLTDNLRFIMHLRDVAKAKFNQDKSVESWEKYKKAKNFATQAVRNEKKAFFNHLCKCKDSKQIWKQLQNLNMRKTESTGVLPDQLKDADRVNEYFINSVPNVSHDNKDFLHYLNNTFYDRVKGNDFHFVLATEEDIFNIIRDSIKTDAVGVDGINISIIKICYPVIKDALINIINSCILSGYYPNAWKTAIVKPIPKKSEIEEFKDLRPISLLPTFSKILEHILNKQIKSYVYRNCILPDHQSGFRSSHSCTTALLKVTDDILEAVDTGESSVLVMLDYSKAFDCLNPNILISMLHYYGFAQESLKIIQSYFCDRYQVVQIDSFRSKPIKLSRGVPQGSVLGPMLYSIYTSRIGDVARFSKLHAYADDTQVYNTFESCCVDRAVNNINQDLDRIYKESIKYELVLNPSKTKVIFFSPKNWFQENIDKIKIEVNGTTLEVVDEAKNLGVTIDSKFRYKTHVAQCVRKAYNNLRQLYPNRHFLSAQLKAQLCNSLVLSHFTHALPVYAPAIDTSDQYKIQKVQNSCLRFIFGIRKFQHISHTLQQICWLNMKNRSLLNMLTLYHSIILRKEPAYLFEKIEFRRDVHSRDVRNKTLLSIPYHKSALYERSFSYSISTLYNSIPEELKKTNLIQFKKRTRKWLYNNQVSSI
nr:unnamed protein product [Callosobruchus analis]